MASSRGKTALGFARIWHAVSAKDRTLGQLASRIAWVLQGKHKPFYDPAVDTGDYVTVTNALDVHLSGKKSTDKVYVSHSGFMGGLKEVPIGRMRERRPEEIIRKAVSSMLPKNTFRQRRLERLKIFAGEENPYAENVVKVFRGETPARDVAERV
ncbi:hypothetical protein NliqN6_0080 [Naganishia liquefaciens]|uniref:50S ribosomal protein L13 n=1 Tax=Naganishia liquefaciens TaxID=104408 RepID=A0A8H3YC01_9TREE|nr:hypothetical protein NliqN6_0080 [Naganishia liquefaciens]